VVHFNLALALEDTAGPAVACDEYRLVLELDPDFADAHYNLAGLCEQLGHASDALRHSRAYQKLSQT
jgi:tetratricopeptide (TPR) repeat protein